MSFVAMHSMHVVVLHLGQLETGDLDSPHTRQIRPYLSRFVCARSSPLGPLGSCLFVDHAETLSSDTAKTNVICDRTKEEEEEEEKGRESSSRAMWTASA